MTIRVVSQRKGGVQAEHGETIIDVSRPSILGNPFVLTNEMQRDLMVKAFQQHIHMLLRKDGSVHAYLVSLANRSKRGERIALRCWCAPKRCHADVIKAIIEQLEAQLP